MIRTLKNTFGSIAFRTANMLGYKPAVWNAIGGRSLGIATSGVSVSSETSMRVAAWKRGVSLIADTVGKTPFHVFQGNTKDKQHPAWSLVRKWSRWHVISASQFRSTITALALSTGNGLAYIVRDRQTMEPIELRILPTGSCFPVMTARGIRYRIAGRKNTVSPSDIYHVKGFTCDGLWGIDPITGYARDVLGVAIAQQDYAANYYETGGTPTTFAHSETVMDDDQFNRVSERLNKSGGLKNALAKAHEIPICEGFELKSLSPTAEQTQIISAREFTLKDIGNALGLSVHKINGDGKSSYKSLEEENRAFREDTIDPLLCQHEDQASKLLTEDQQATESHRIYAVRESLTRTNSSDRREYLAKATGGPWMTQNEAREIEGKDPVEGGDELLKPLNMTETGATDGEAASQTSEPETQDTETDDRSDKAVAALAAVFQRMNKRLSIQARKAASKSKDFPEFLTGLNDRNDATIASALKPVVELISQGTADDQRAENHVGEFRRQLAETYDTATPDDFPAAVAELCDRWESLADEHAAQLFKVIA